MDADRFVARWIIIIHDESQPGQAPPWKTAMPLGSSFEIVKDAFDSYWFLPSPELKAPMNQPRQLAVSNEKHGGFDVGRLLDGTLFADFGGKSNVVYFSLNLVSDKRRVISLSQSHGGIHGVDV